MPHGITLKYQPVNWFNDNDSSPENLMRKCEIDLESFCLVKTVLLYLLNFTN